MLKSITALSVVAAHCTLSLAQTPAPVPSVSPAPQLNRADLEAWLDGLIPYALEDGDIAGLLVSVVKDGQVLLEKGYGYADIAKKTTMDPGRTVINVASVSKTFTATAVMQLVEQGKLELDEDVNAYLDFTIPPAFGKPITLRNLLTHTAGFQETSYRRYNPPLTLRQHLLMIPERIYPPGDVPAYSNYGLNLAGYIVARVSGEPIPVYIERHILEPMQMSHSTFHMTLPEALQPFAAKNYALASSGEPYPLTTIKEMMPTEAPAGGLSTTAHDMTRFMMAHLQHGRYGDYRLLQPQTLELMHAPAFTPMAGAQAVALGLFLDNYRGHRVVGHSGDGEGLHAEMTLLPDQNIGIFTAVNSDGIVQGIFPAAFTLRAKLFQLFMDRYFPTPSAPQEATALTAQEHARAIAGEYVWSRQQKGDYQEALALIIRFLALKPFISANSDGTIDTAATLTFEKNGRPQTWREVAPFVWREVGGDAHLLAKVANGQVQSVWSDQVTSFWVNLRVPFLWSSRLNVPLLGLSVGVMLLTALAWPVAVLVRRRYGHTLQPPSDSARVYRLTQFAAVIGVLYMVCWVIALAADFGSQVGVTPWIRLFQLIGLSCVVGAAVAVWNAWLTSRSGKSVGAKLWSAMLALALLYLAWFSFAFHLISMHLN
jgi:CubicO group peptidase (beta-lactamase class C family)